jgi:hypothetical protein
VGTQPGRPVALFAFEPDGTAKHQRAKDPQRNDADRHVRVRRKFGDEYV